VAMGAERSVLSNAISCTGLLGLVVFVCGAGAVASDDLSLQAKARLFGTDLSERFVDDGQVRVRRRLPTEAHPYVTFNMSDTAYMTGIYCATETWRYMSTGDPTAAANARAAANALVHLIAVTGIPGLLARASTPTDERWFDDGTWYETADGRYRWRGNVSSDQIDAMVFGLFVYGTQLASAEERLRLGSAVGAVVDAVIDNGYRVIGYDGRPTRWGRYELDYVTDEEPMNALLLLQMVKVAHVLTQATNYDREYRRLIDNGYARIGEGARLDEPPLEANHSDDVLIALALYPLLELETSAPVRANYLRAAYRWFRGGVFPGIDVEANPLATFLYQHWTGEDDQRAAAVETLRHVPLDMKWNTETVLGYAERFGFRFEADPVEPFSGTEPLPISQRGRIWSFLVQNPYRLGGDRLTSSPFETNGLDFLVSYWFGRFHGMLDESE